MDANQINAGTTAWTPTNWKTKPIKQDVVYEDKEHVQKVLGKLEQLPPLVTPKEIENLREQLKQVALGNSFLLQGGDCAELFDYCSQGPIEAKLKVLLQMSLVLTWGARTSVVRIARMAGQYAKPRSKPTEMHNGQEILSYRGDNVNGFDPSDRTPDPERLLGAYFHSAATMNYLRSLLDSGFADLHEPSNWNLDHVRSEAVRGEYQNIVTQLTDALDFMRTIGADNSQQQSASSSVLRSVDFFVSHEALLLDFETALTRLLPSPSSKTKKWYNAGAHFLWIGDRTRQPDGAHIEYMRGIENPIGIKVGPTTEPDKLVELLNTLNPSKDIGKITLITRFGAGKVDTHLAQHIEAVRQSGHIPVWVCDPMHGNTKSVSGGIKTRHFVDICQELSQTFRVHKMCGSKLNGVHFELTGDSVTECIGGSMDLKDTDLSTNYQSYCDPRLNYEQSLDIAFLIAKYYQKERKNEEFPSL
ncbi:DAHP synthetase [Radiomyces spectabilis]|uniref:DAHP synthetase n=1 Tax=Radiomyces spectabilis TaxID=64574 RepID=UPI0022212008|nr:DAHP synthetase [Radiomyces spectabilis]KAI8371586.1 DAHP synthetase [Radiomyces spectabilis]